MAGADSMESVRAELEPHALPAVTLSVPEVNEAENETVTEFVPCPAVTVALGGATQL